jgi:hypothetical protein
MMLRAMALAEYECGCTWVGERKEVPDYCAQHGDDRRKVHLYPRVPEKEQGWSDDPARH